MGLRHLGVEGLRDRPARRWRVALRHHRRRHGGRLPRRVPRVDAPHRLVSTEAFEGLVAMGITDDPDSVASVNTVTLEEVDGVTTMSTLVRHVTKEHRDGHLHSGHGGRHAGLDEPPRGPRHRLNQKRLRHRSAGTCQQDGDRGVRHSGDETGGGVIAGAVVLLAACSSSREAGDPSTTPSASTESTAESSPATSSTTLPHPTPRPRRRPWRRRRRPLRGPRARSPAAPSPAPSAASRRPAHRSRRPIRSPRPCG